jgi:hypothetical protein
MAKMIVALSLASGRKASSAFRATVISRAATA